MKLIPISEHPDHAKILYGLLEERPEYANISHKKMPTWEEHLAFIETMTPGTPEECYSIWDLIEVDGRVVGMIYLTQRDEIGVGIFSAEQRKGYATAAIKLLMQQCMGGRFLANVAPGNEPSRNMFEKLGFKVIQHTYCLEAE